MAPGISIHFIPDADREGEWKLVVYADEWENGSAVQSAMFIRETVDLYGENIGDLSNFKLGILVTELAGQIIENSMSAMEDSKYVRSVVEHVMETQKLPRRE